MSLTGHLIPPKRGAQSDIPRMHQRRDGRWAGTSYGGSGDGKLKVPQEQKPRGRLWLNDGSCVWLRPERANPVWSYDFVSPLTHHGRTLRLLTLIDEFTRECLAIRVARRLGSQ